MTLLQGEGAAYYLELFGVFFLYFVLFFFLYLFFLSFLSYFLLFLLPLSIYLSMFRSSFISSFLVLSCCVLFFSVLFLFFLPHLPGEGL